MSKNFQLGLSRDYMRGVPHPWFTRYFELDQEKIKEQNAETKNPKGAGKLKTPSLKKPARK